VDRVKTPLDNIRDLFKPTTLLVSPAWKGCGYTHAILPKELPSFGLGKFEVVEYVYCPNDMGVLLFPCGKVVIVQFSSGPLPEPEEVTE
jgi:hypothetical protein